MGAGVRYSWAYLRRSSEKLTHRSPAVFLWRDPSEWEGRRGQDEVAERGHGLHSSLLERAGMMPSSLCNSAATLPVDEATLISPLVQVIDFELPITVKLKVVDVDPGLRGDTAQGTADFTARWKQWRRGGYDLFVRRRWPWLRLQRCRRVEAGDAGHGGGRECPSVREHRGRDTGRHENRAVHEPGVGCGLPPRGCFLSKFCGELATGSPKL